MRHAAIGLAVTVVFVVAGCDVFFPPPPADPPDVNIDTRLRAVLASNGVEPLHRPVVDVAKVALGQALFFDKLLSGNRNIACSTCHLPDAATSDDLCTSIGEGGSGQGTDRVAPEDQAGAPILIPRNAPEIFNRATLRTMFWDARVADADDGGFLSPAGDALPEGLDSALAAQAMFPVTSREEMRGQPGDNELADAEDADFTGIWNGLAARLAAIPEYMDLFAAAYPDVAPGEYTFAHAANAIAAFEIEHWTLDDAPFDAYLRGDNAALSLSAKRGAFLFYGEARCAMCHSGTLMTDEIAHNRVVPQIGPGKGDGVDGVWDFGRARETGMLADRFRFRTPPLRNVADTGPWMHDGVFMSLEAVVRHELDPIGSARAYDPSHLPTPFVEAYRAEQTETIIAAADPGAVAPVDLTDSQIADLMAFLESLSSPEIANLPDRDWPERVPSGLPLDD